VRRSAIQDKPTIAIVAGMPKIKCRLIAIIQSRTVALVGSAPTT